MTDEEERIHSIDEQESRLDRLEAKLDQLLSGAHGKAEASEERKLDRPTEVQEMVRMELEKADRERAAAAKAEAEKSEQQTIRDNVAKLMEGKPVQPQPRRQRLMWGKR